MRIRSELRTILVASFVLLLAANVEIAADNTKTPQAGSADKSKQSIDDQLLDGLDNALLEGLDTQPSGKSSGPAGSASDRSGGKDNGKGASSANPPDGPTAAEKSKPQSQSDKPLDDALPRELGGEDIGATSEASPDPLVGIGRRMRDVESRLAGQQLDDQTKQMQKQILDDLSALMKECKKQCQGGGNNPSSRSGKPSSGAQAGKSPAAQAPRDSSDQLRDRKTERADRSAITNAMKESWGHLPERERQRIANSATDEFLPKYERMLEKYFKRLAEEDLDQP